MRAVRLLRFGAALVDADIADREPHAGEERVTIRASGICHSDGHYRAGRGQVTLPVTLGHEIAGVTDAGERVAIHYLLRDGSMLGKEVDGGYSESIIVPRENLVPIPDQVPFEQAAVMMCSTATASHALRVASFHAGESVAILGFGGLGASAVQLARVLGAGEVFAVDRVAQKRDVAKHSARSRFPAIFRRSTSHSTSPAMRISVVPPFAR